MPRYLYKPVQELDFYVEWSTIVEAVVGWGTKESFRNEDPDFYAEERFERADRTGTSAIFGNASWDDDREEIFMQRGFIKRSQLKTLCDLLEQGHMQDDEEDAEINALLEPLDC